MIDSALMDAILAAIRTLRPMPGISENELHEEVKQAFADAGLEFKHEASLGPRCRIDFLVGNIGIELKKGKTSHGRLITQIERYMKSDSVEAIILLTGRGAMIPKLIGGKPCVTVTIGALWGIALR